MRISQPIREPLPAIDSIVVQTAVESASLPQFASETFTITAPAGYAYQLLGFYFYVDAVPGASGGTHTMDIDGKGTNALKVNGSSVFNSALYYKYGYWLTADSSQAPPAGSDQFACLRSFWAVGADTIVFTYTNMADANQTGSREYEAVLRMIKIA